jgi:hypothetical protein
MISVFNGRSRGIGQRSRQDVYIQVQVKLRSHLHLFKNARLAVFLAIALHSNEDGWADPSVELLRQETGYNKDTIARALTDLCDLVLDGQRVLLAAQQRQPGGVFAKNRYLVFPSPEECAKYETSGELRKPRMASYEPVSSAEPSIENQYTVDASPSIENQYTVENEVQAVTTPENGDSPSIGFPSTVFPYGRRTILKNHDDDDGDARARFFRELRGRDISRKKAKIISAMDVDPETVLTAIDTLLSAGKDIGDIILRIEDDPPEKGQPYGQSNGRPVHPEPAAARAERPAIAAARPRGKHAPTGGSDIHDPGWRERLIAEFEQKAAEAGISE